MKKLMLSLSLCLFLFACSNEKMESEDQNQDNQSEQNESGNNSSQNVKSEKNDTESNLISFENISQNQVIDYNGQIYDNEKYNITDKIEYNPRKNYSLSHGSYVSYFKNDEHIKTIRYEENVEIDQVKNANHIRISFPKFRGDYISLEEV